MNNQTWAEKKAKRFVLFFDILGFKDLVLNSNHNIILSKLEALNNASEFLKSYLKAGRGEVFEKNQTQSITFSDSIVFFSKGNSYLDARKILFDAFAIMRSALIYKIPIKGAVSYGYITVDLKKNLFFGRPIIEAFLLHEELKLMSVILDHNAENKIKSLGKNKVDTLSVIRDYNVPMKFGKVKHKLICITAPDLIKESINDLKKLYLLTSGKSRVYLDNTNQLFKWLKKENT